MRITKETEKEKVNIADILRNAPKRLELYSPLFGEVRIEETSNDFVKVITDTGPTATFFKNGHYFRHPYKNAECLLFPSVNHRTWNNWQNTLFPKSIGSVCVDTITGNKFILCKNGTFFSDGTGSLYSTLIDDNLIDCRDSSNYLLNSRYATPEEAVKFLEDLEKNGYKWDGESRNVVKIDHCKDCINDKGCMNCEDGERKETVPHKFKVGDIVKHKLNAVEPEWTIEKVENGFYRVSAPYSDGTKQSTCIYFHEEEQYELVSSPILLSS